MVELKSIKITLLHSRWELLLHKDKLFFVLSENKENKSQNW